jgi:hypothetical protein
MRRAYESRPIVVHVVQRHDKTDARERPCSAVGEEEEEGEEEAGAGLHAGPVLYPRQVRAHPKTMHTCNHQFMVHFSRSHAKDSSSLHSSSIPHCVTRSLLTNSRRRNLNSRTKPGICFAEGDQVHTLHVQHQTKSLILHVDISFEILSIL